VRPDQLAVFLALLFLNAFFCAAESALTAASLPGLEAEADRGSKRARDLLKLLQDRPRVVAALLIGQNLVGAALAVYSTIVIDQNLGANLPEWLAALLAVLISLSLTLLFGEVIPKSLAISFANRFALTFALPVAVTTWLFAPLTFALKKLSGVLLGLLGARGAPPTLTVEEIQAIARMGRSIGVIDEIEGRIIQRASELNEKRVRELMTPRVDIKAIPARSSLPEVQRRFTSAMFSRMPVYLDDLDDILGVLNFKEFLRLTPTQTASFRLEDYLHPALFVPEAQPAGDVVERMRNHGTHMAIVIDEYGGTSGLVTLSDIVKALLGHVGDEYDVVTQTVVESEQGLVVDGRVHVDELAQRLGVKLAPALTEGVDTAAGLAIKLFGTLPAEGDEITAEGLTVKVLAVDQRRVKRVMFRKAAP
jgi:putative hemolysin